MTRFLLSAALLALASATCVAANAQKPLDPGSPGRLFGKVVYVFPGARDSSGTAFTGVATAVTCTNIGPEATKFEFIAKAYDRSVEEDFATSWRLAGATFTYSTHNAVVYFEDYFGAGFVLSQGSITVRSLSVNVVCTANVVDAASSSPIGWDLHGIRYNPAAGTQE